MRLQATAGGAENNTTLRAANIQPRLRYGFTRGQHGKLGESIIKRDFLTGKMAGLIIGFDLTTDTDLQAINIAEFQFGNP